MTIILMTHVLAMLPDMMFDSYHATESRAEFAEPWAFEESSPACVEMTLDLNSYFCDRHCAHRIHYPVLDVE